jgi:hypothetical protein
MSTSQADTFEYTVGYSGAHDVLPDVKGKEAKNYPRLNYWILFHLL